MNEKEHSIKDHFNLQGNIKDPDEKEPVEALQTQKDVAKPSKEEQKRTEDALRKTTDLPEEFDLSKIGDIDFLLDIFAEPYDKFKSLQYLTKMRDKLLKRGYPETPILNEYLFWTAISRRLQIEYQIIHVRNVKSGRIEAEHLPMLKTMKGVAEQVASLQKSLNETLERFEKISSIADLHQETLDEIEKFVQEHVGEYSFRCSKCGTVVNTQGLPHWAIEKHDEPTGEKIYFVFSSEMWYLYRKDLLPLSMIAFILRTSVEGVLVTAKERRGKIPKISDSEILKEEKRSKQLLLEFTKKSEKNRDG